MTADRVAKELADILDDRATPARTRAPCGDRTQRHLRNRRLMRQIPDGVCQKFVGGFLTQPSVVPSNISPAPGPKRRPCFGYRFCGWLETDQLVAELDGFQASIGENLDAGRHSRDEAKVVGGGHAVHQPDEGMAFHLLQLGAAAAILSW